MYDCSSRMRNSKLPSTDFTNLGQNEFLKRVVEDHEKMSSISLSVCCFTKKCHVIKPPWKRQQLAVIWTVDITSPSKGTLYCASPEASWCQQGNTLIQVQRDISCTFYGHCGMWLMLCLLNDTFLVVKNDTETDLGQTKVFYCFDVLIQLWY